MLLFIILVLIVVYLLLKTPRANRESPVPDWKVYGTMNCGWTVKQLDHMKSKGIPHTFMDCDKGMCDGMNAYPTLKSPEGVISEGFKEF